jgi:bifunctional DNase/RNase
VEITELHDGTYFAEIALRRGEETLRVSARPSDAIALAVRMGHEVPILAADAVLDEAGVVYEADEEPEDEVLAAAPDIEEFREFLDTVSPEDFAD